MGIAAMIARRIPKGIVGDLMLLFGVAMWCAGYVIGRAIGCIERAWRRRFP
jgi:hypothetical protein